MDCGTCAKPMPNSRWREGICEGCERTICPRCWEDWDECECDYG